MGTSSNPTFAAFSPLAFYITGFFIGVLVLIGLIQGIRAAFGLLTNAFHPHEKFDR